MSQLFGAEVGDPVLTAGDLYEEHGSYGLRYPDVAYDSFGDAGSLWGKIKHAASKVAHGVIKHDPFSHLVNAALHGQNIGHAFHDAIRTVGNDLKHAAPYAQMLASVVPGIGPGLSAAISAGSALAQGKKLSDALVGAIRQNLPGGQAAMSAFDSAVSLAHGGNITSALASAARDALPDDPQARRAFDAGVALAHGQSMQRAAIQAVETQLPGAAAVRAFRQSLARGVPLQQAAQLVGGEQVSQLVANATGALPSQMFSDYKDVAQAILCRPELHRATRGEIAARLGVPLELAVAGLAAAVKLVMESGEGTNDGAPPLQRAPEIERRIKDRTTFDGAVVKLASKAAPTSTTPGPRRYMVRLAHPARHGIMSLLHPRRRARVYDAMGLNADGSAWDVTSGDTPIGIATTLTGSGARYTELLDANPGKDQVDVYNVVDGANPNGHAVSVARGAPPPVSDIGLDVTPAGRNFKSLNPGESLQLPPDWQKKTPPPPDAPPPPPKTADIVNSLPAEKLIQIKMVLAAWGNKTNKISPADYATSFLHEDNWTAIDTQALASYQTWANANDSEALRTDGVLDQASYDSLVAYATRELGGLPVVAPPPPPPHPLPVRRTTLRRKNQTT